VTVAAEVERGRRAYEEHAWSLAFESLAAADGDEALAAEDLELLAIAAYMLGRVDDSLGALEHAHHGYASAGEPLRAARTAVYSGSTWRFSGTWRRRAAG